VRTRTPGPIDDEAVLRCPRCHCVLAARPGLRRRVSSYDDCVRRCDRCGVGYSNARHGATIVFRDPLENLPLELRDGVDAALALSLNGQTRKTKRRRLGFSTSEDALTWTIFAWLARDQLQVLRTIGYRLFGLADVQEATVLLWGAPVPPTSKGDDVRLRLVQVLDTLGEHSRRRSEPDVVIDYGRGGLVLVEVKWRAPNDIVLDARVGKFDRYVDGSVSFAAPALAKKSGLYELVRNWRIGWDLAAGRPFRLVNLGPESLFQSPALGVLKGALPHSSDKRFQTLSWNEFLRVLKSEFGGIPHWLRAWLHERGVQ
jgi:hypothetical protein